MFLSDMSPFTFADIGSANPVVYDEFCDFIKIDRIEIENSFKLACKYIDWLNNPFVTTAFEWVTQEEWIKKSQKFVNDRSSTGEN